MTFEAYLAYFEDVLNGKIVQKPYDDPHFIEYTKLNHARQARWLKKGNISDETKNILQSINQKQQWILITEPWCGDAAHSVPFMAKMAETSPIITLKIQLRDSEESEIEHYLTNGGKSIPKLIVRDDEGNDLFVWGPRPKACQDEFNELKEAGASFEELKIGLQKWYNDDQGRLIQQEICQQIMALHA
jgi:hypothetical protein